MKMVLLLFLGTWQCKPVAEGGPGDVLLTVAEHPESAALQGRVAGVEHVPSVQQQRPLLPELDVDQVLAWLVDNLVSVGVVKHPSPCQVGVFPQHFALPGYGDILSQSLFIARGQSNSGLAATRCGADPLDGPGALP